MLIFEIVVGVVVVCSLRTYLLLLSCPRTFCKRLGPWSAPGGPGGNRASVRQGAPRTKARPHRKSGPKRGPGRPKTAAKMSQDSGPKRHKTAAQNVTRRRPKMSQDGGPKCHKTAAQNVTKGRPKMSQDGGPKCHETAAQNVTRRRPKMSQNRGA